MTVSDKRKFIWPIITGLFFIITIVGIIIFKNLDKFSDKELSNVLILVISAIFLLVITGALLKFDEIKIQQRENDIKKGALILALIIIGALVFRVYIGLIHPGYPADMSCWTSWSQAAAGSGFFSVYSNTSFLDYPPGYLYILHILGSAGNLLGIECYSPAYNLLLKLPAIIADVVLVGMIYKIGKSRINTKAGLVLATLYAINPIIILNSAAWGQIDSILTLIVVGYLILLYKNRITAATLVFIAGLLIKPQMLFFGPVLAVVFIQYLKKNGWKKGMKTFLISFSSGIALFIAVILPFNIGEEWYWIFEKYVGTISSYNYITLNSANIYGLLGLNWMPIENVKYGLSLANWGLIGLGIATTAYFILAFLNKNRKNIFILSATLMTGLYALGLKMHERYIFPVIAILLIAYIYDKKDSLLVIFGILSAAVFINVAQVLAIIHIPPDDIFYRITSATVVALYLCMLVFSVIEVTKSRKSSEILEKTDCLEAE